VIEARFGDQFGGYGFVHSQFGVQPLEACEEPRLVGSSILRPDQLLSEAREQVGLEDDGAARRDRDIPANQEEVGSEGEVGAPAQSNRFLIERNGMALKSNARVGVTLEARSTQVDSLVLQSPGLIDEHGHAALGDVGDDAAASAG
jgi:hypothetical protein